MTNSHLKQGTIANSNNSPHLVKVFNIHEQYCQNIIFALYPIYCQSSLHYIIFKNAT